MMMIMMMLLSWKQIFRYKVSYFHLYRHSSQPVPPQVNESSRSVVLPVEVPRNPLNMPQGGT